MPRLWLYQYGPARQPSNLERSPRSKLHPPKLLWCRTEERGNASSFTPSRFSFYFVVQGTGFHADPSESFLKCVLVANGIVRYWGSSTMFVTISQGPPTASGRTLKYSVTTAFPL